MFVTAKCKGGFPAVHPLRIDDGIKCIFCTSATRRLSELRSSSDTPKGATPVRPAPWRKWMVGIKSLLQLLALLAEFLGPFVERLGFLHVAASVRILGFPMQFRSSGVMGFRRGRRGMRIAVIAAYSNEHNQDGNSGLPWLDLAGGILDEFNRTSGDGA